MIKKIFFLFPVFFISIFSQFKPDNYLMDFNLKKISSIKDDNPASNSISDIIVVGDTIWLGSSRGLSRSTNNGLTWKNFYNTNPFGTESISAIGYFEGKIFAATAHSVERDGQNLPEGTGIKFSSDNGETWKSIPQSIDAQDDSSIIYGINNIRALPVTVTIQNLIYDISFTSNTIWIATFAGGLRKNSISALIANQNAQWQRVVIPPDKLSSIKPTDTLNFSLQPVAGKFGPENNLNHRLFSVLAINDSTILAGSANGINKSTDFGISWKKFNHQNQPYPISGNFIVALGYSKLNNTIWAASWKAEDQTESYAVSYSDNGGDIWYYTLIDEKPHNFGIHSVSGSTKIIVATDNGPYLSVNSKTNWILPGAIIDSYSKLPLRTSEFYSAAFENNGSSAWIGSTDGLVKNNSITTSWSNDWKIFFASQSLSNKEDTYAYPNPFSPKSEIVKIKYNTSSSASIVTIRIFDFAMNYIRTVAQNVQRGGTMHVINSTDANGINGVIDFWDGKDDNGKIVPNGVYFYKIDIDSNSPIFGKIMVLQ